MLSSFGSMDKMILLVLIFVGRSYQRPQLELDASNATETSDAAAATTEETKSSEKIIQVTEAPAVSVQTSVNVSSYVPSEVYEDFKPSNYYRPDGNPIFERPSPQVTHEVFYVSERFKRPNDSAYRRPSPPRPDDKNVVFPQATQEHVLRSNGSDGPQSRSPHRFTETTAAQSKPMKHDYGEVVPSFGHYDDYFYEKNVGNYYGNEMSHYPDFIREPPKPYHDVTTRKKKDPWRNVLSVLATILPVGLLLASFPPTVIKVNSTQYPYQFQRNATSYNPDNIIVGRYKAMRKKKTRSKIDGGDDESSRNLDDCLKRKLCESIKTNYLPSELDSVLQNNKPDPTNNSPNAMLEIAKAAVSTSPESCQVFVCSN